MVFSASVGLLVYLLKLSTIQPFNDALWIRATALQPMPRTNSVGFDGIAALANQCSGLNTRDASCVVSRLSPGLANWLLRH